MEKRWKMSKLEADRAAYRAACRHANVTIMNRYRTYFRDKICDVLRLLVCDGTQSRDCFTRRPPLNRSQMETSKLSARGLLCFFGRKVTNIKESIKDKLIGRIYDPLTSYLRPSM